MKTRRDLELKWTGKDTNFGGPKVSSEREHKSDYTIPNFNSNSESATLVPWNDKGKVYVAKETFIRICLFTIFPPIWNIIGL
jgi:hypothetical protein